ncbi:MAG TPA: sugar phosphate nucleotidyltransferase [bacterium]|nr:sugar phosphate nucleotidyltransferase [bacterium]
MQAVILAAGKSTRCYPLTLTRPKPLLPLVSRTIIEHTLSQLEGLVDEVIIVVGYQKEMIISYLGTSFSGLKLRFIDQQEQKGTGHALMMASDFLKNRFLVLSGDDIYFRQDLEKCLAHDLCLLVAEHRSPEHFGVVRTNGQFVEDIAEKPKNAKSNLVNTSAYVLNRSVFELELKLSERGEFELVDYIRLLSDVYWEKVEKAWMPVTFPWNLLEANVLLLQEIEPQILGKVDDNVRLNGNVYIGKNSIIRSGCVIDGPAYIGDNCIIGPNAYIRPDTVIGANCEIGFGVEIVDSLIFDHVFCKHRSYIGHSVIGSHVNLGAGFITADWRHDGKTHVTLVKGKKVDTLRDKLGAFIGDRVMTGIHTSVYPGRKIAPDATTLPGEVITADR